MSLAFSTLVIALFALMPGFFFEHFLYAGKMGRVRAPTPTLTDLAVSVGLSIPIHVLTLAILETLGLLRARIDFLVFMEAITGQFGAKGEGLPVLAASVQEFYTPIALYLFSTALVGLVLGQLTQYALLSFPLLDQLLPFRNRWFNTFFFPYGDRVSACEAFVLTKASAESRPLLYRGDIKDFSVSSAGELLDLRLGKPRRAVLNTRPEAHTEGTGEWLDLEQDVFILIGEQINNLSLKYRRARRPLAILARATTAVPAGTPSPHTIDLLARVPWWRRQVLKLVSPDNFFILPLEPEFKARLDVEGYRLTLTPDAPPANDVKVHIVGALMGVLDGRSELTGNFLFWIHQRVIDFWSRWLQGRVKWPEGERP